MRIPEELGTAEYCYLTTTGRVSGQPHTIEIWFALKASSLFDLWYGLGMTSLYMLAGNHGSDWVRNLRRRPAVDVQVAESRYRGQARLVVEAEEDAHARRLLVAKYQPRSASDLNGWGHDALPVAIDLSLESGQV